MNRQVMAYTYSRTVIPNQSVLALTAPTWAFNNCMSLISKTIRAFESGLDIPTNFFEKHGGESGIRFLLKSLKDMHRFFQYLSTHTSDFAIVDGEITIRLSVAFL